MAEWQPGGALGGYRIESVEWATAGAAMLRAQDTAAGREVVLHVAPGSAGSLLSTRFLEHAKRLGAVRHPNVLPVFSASAMDGHAVAVAPVPDGRRLDRVLASGPLPTRTAARIARQVASAIAALEAAGAEPPPLRAEYVWIRGGARVYLDALEPADVGAHAPSAAAEVAGLVVAMTGRENVPGALGAVLAHAREGAYLSAAQFADALSEIEARRALAWRTALIVAALAVAAVVLVLAVS